MSGVIPQSTALAEASPDSLSELMSRDPEGFSRQDLDRLVEALRAQRVRWQAAEAEAQASGKRPNVRQPKVTASPASASDLGL
jgi:hypothetical protein